jgi:hypothetical protein
MSKSKKKTDAVAAPAAELAPVATPPKVIGTVDGVSVFSGARAPRATGGARVTRAAVASLPAATMQTVAEDAPPSIVEPFAATFETPAAPTNGHANGHANGSHANGNGASNGHANGASNGHTNGHTTNGHANGHTNGAPHVEPPMPVDPEAAAIADFHKRLRDRDDRRWDKTQAPIPMGTTEAIQLWDTTVRVRGIPAEACNLWAKQVGAGVDMYEFLIEGRQVGGADPGRALYEHARKARQCPSKYEEFSIRIEAPADNGRIIPCGTGMLRLAPDLTTPNAFAGAWGSQGAPGTQAAGNGGGGGGLEAMLPFLKGMPAPMIAMMMAGGGQGMPSWLLPMLMMQGGSSGGGWFGSAREQVQAPKAVANDPAMLEIWKLLRDSTSSNNNAQTALLTKLMDRMFEQKEPEKKADDPDKTIDRMLTFAERINGLTDRTPPETKKNGLTIHSYNGAAIVENADGSVNGTMSAVLSLKDDFKEVIKSRAEATATALALSSAQAPRMGK